MKTDKDAIRRMKLNLSLGMYTAGDLQRAMRKVLARAAARPLGSRSFDLRPDGRRVAL